MEKVIIKKWGNSAAIRLSNEMLEHLGTSSKISSPLEVRMLPEGILLSPIPIKYTLEDFIANYDPAADMDDEEFNMGPPVGEEIIDDVTEYAVLLMDSAYHR